MRRLTVAMVALTVVLGVKGFARAEIVLLTPDSADATSLWQRSGEGPGNLFDRDFGGGADRTWVSIYPNGQENYCWMEYDWNRLVTLASSAFYLDWPGDPVNLDPVLEYRIKYWPDAGWADLAHVYNSDMNKWLYTDALAGITTEKLRIDFLNATDLGSFTENGQWMGYDVVAIREWEVRGSAVPEPCTLIVWSLLGASGVTLGWWRRRKRAG